MLFVGAGGRLTGRAKCYVLYALLFIFEEEEDNNKGHRKIQKKTQNDIRYTTYTIIIRKRKVDGKRA